MRGIEPRAFHMQSERSTTELHPLMSITPVLQSIDLPQNWQTEKNMEMPGIEPGAFHMQSERSTTEPHPPVVIPA